MSAAEVYQPSPIKRQRSTKTDITAAVLDWRDYIPLAKSKTSKIYRKQERGKFRYEELLSAAVEGLGNAAEAFDVTRNNGLAAYALKRRTGWNFPTEWPPGCEPHLGSTTEAVLQ
jgi:hypothetical protein